MAILMILILPIQEHGISFHFFEFIILFYIFILYFILFIYLFLLFRAAPVAYGCSQARGQIGAAAAGLCHSHSNPGSDSDPCLRPTPQLMATLDP